MLNQVIIEENEDLLTKIKILKKAWPGKLEISYFLFTICWNSFRAFKTSTVDFLLKEKRQNTVTFKRLGNQPETKNKRAHSFLAVLRPLVLQVEVVYFII